MNTTRAPQFPASVLVRMHEGTNRLVCKVWTPWVTQEQGAPVATLEAPQGYAFAGGETSLVLHTPADLDLIESGETLTRVEVDFDTPNNNGDHADPRSGYWPSEWTRER